MSLPQLFFFSFGLRRCCFNLQREWTRNSGLWMPNQWYFQQKEFTNGFVISLSYPLSLYFMKRRNTVCFSVVSKVKLATLKMLTLDTTLLAIPHLRIRLYYINLFSLGNNCIDKHNLCKQWAKDNLCERGNETMDSQSVQKVCSKSCSVCFKWAVQQVSSYFYKGAKFRHFISRIRDSQYLKINLPLVLRCS